MVTVGRHSKVSLEAIHQLSVVEKKNNTEIADLLDVDEASVRRAKKRYNKEYSYLLDTEISRAYRSELDKPLYLPEMDGWGVTGDWHLPLTDMELANYFLSTCKNKGIPNLLMGGDIINADEVSDYMPKQKNANREVERTVACYTIDKLLDMFENLVIIRGNHDYREVKARNYTITYTEAMYEYFEPIGDKRDRIIFSNLDHCFIEAHSGRYRVCHPKSYSQVPGTVALKLAAKYREEHIVCAHSHHCALLYQKDGVHLAVEIGGFFDAEQTQYLQDTTTFPKWTNGFGTLTPEDGFLLYSGNRKRSTWDQLHGASSALVLP